MAENWNWKNFQISSFELREQLKTESVYFLKLLNPIKWQYYLLCFKILTFCSVTHIDIAVQMKVELFWKIQLIEKSEQTVDRDLN